MKRFRPSRAGLLVSMLATGLCAHVRADNPPSCHVECFRMSLADWNRVSPAIRNDSILVPQKFSRFHQGTTLVLESGTKDEGTYPVHIILDHDLRKPQLPATDGHARALISPEQPVSYRISVNETLNMSPGVWMAVKEVPLAPILGDLDSAAKKDSCYVYGRVLNLDAANRP